MRRSAREERDRAGVAVAARAGREAQRSTDARRAGIRRLQNVCAARCRVTMARRHAHCAASAALHSR